MSTIRYENFLIEHDCRALVSTASLLDAKGEFVTGFEPFVADGEDHQHRICRIVEDFWVDQMEDADGEWTAGVYGPARELLDGRAA